MKFEITGEEGHKAKIPHEIFLTNLIANHILWFVASLGVVRSYWQPLALVPVVSLGVLFYILWRARKSRSLDPWFVMCHWQIAATRSKIFLVMICLLLLIAACGWAGHAYLGLMKEAVFALIGGTGLLPVMVTVLILIIAESDTLHRAAQHELPPSIVEKFPNPAVRAIAE